MRNKISSRLLGIILIWIGIFGIIFSISGISITWYLKPIIQDSLIGVIDTLDLVFINTSDALLVLDSTLDSSIDNLDIIHTSLNNLDTTFDNISFSLESSANLIGGDLRLTIIDTQVALSSAAVSAGIVDNTLRFLAAIPLIGADYRPEVPLSTSLENVSESLTDIPDAFTDFEQYISETAESMTLLQTDLSNLAGNINNYENDLEDARTVISEYVLIIIDLREKLSGFQNDIPNIMFLISFLITGGFFLLGVAQITTLRQGIAYRNGDVIEGKLPDDQQEENS